MAGMPRTADVICLVVEKVVGVLIVVVVNYTGICHKWRLWDFAAVLTAIRIRTQIVPARLKALCFQGRRICDFAVCLARI
jgi:hypothetical protein